MTTQSYAKASADRARKVVSITSLLSRLGYEVVEDHREQQFRCDLHGSGQDNKPSARVYPHNNNWYCFACGKARDVISTLRDKKGLSFWEAIQTLEQWFHLPKLEGDFDTTRRDRLVDDVDGFLNPQEAYPQVRDRVLSLLRNLTQDKSLPLPLLLELWEKFDKYRYFTESPDKTWSVAQGKVAMSKLHAVIMKRAL